MTPLKRILTEKSKLGFGKYKDSTVQQLIDRRQKLRLISPYYTLTSIDYTESVLNTLGITQEYRISKPGKDKVMYYKFLNENGYEKPRRGLEEGANIMKRFSKPYSKASLQGVNHGHK